MAKPILTLERVQEVFSYDPETGELTALTSSQNGYRRAGEPAGYINAHGYVVVTVDDYRYYVHRIAWLFMTGSWPEKHIDHVDHDKSNNRFKNLREASHQQNCQHVVRPRKHNTSGFLGVSRDKNRWVATIVTNRKKKHLGSFLTREEAHAAYLEAKRKLHPFSTI